MVYCKLLVRCRNLNEYLTLIGPCFLAEFFVYVFTNFDWLSLHGFFDLQFLRLNRQPIKAHTLGHLTFP